MTDPAGVSPARKLFADDIVAAELARLAAEQQPDGGWTVGFESSSPAAALEWRGYFTVAAVALLTDAHPNLGESSGAARQPDPPRGERRSLSR